MNKEMKYTASLHINANKENVEFIGNISANSKKELKREAKQHARNWNKHLSGRILISDREGEFEFFVNP